MLIGVAHRLLSKFNLNFKGVSNLWKTEETPLDPPLPKSKGAGIMVSDFIDEHNGFLALNDEEHEMGKCVNLIVTSTSGNMHMNPWIW